MQLAARCELIEIGRFGMGRLLGIYNPGDTSMSLIHCGDLRICGAGAYVHLSRYTAAKERPINIHEEGSKEQASK
jgi:hypothetical protein